MQDQEEKGDDANLTLKLYCSVYPRLGPPLSVMHEKISREIRGNRRRTAQKISLLPDWEIRDSINSGRGIASKSRGKLQKSCCKRHMYKLYSTLDIFVTVFPNSKPFLWRKKKWELECFVGWVNSTIPRLYTGSAAAAERRKRKEGGSWGSACSNTLTHLFGGSGGKKQEEGDDFTRDERGKSPKKSMQGPDTKEEFPLLVTFLLLRRCIFFWAREGGRQPACSSRDNHYC